MSRAKPVVDPLGDDVAYAYLMTTPPQRVQVAEDWIGGNKIKHVQFADLLNLNKDALLIASLLEVEHESICKPSGRPRVTTYGGLLKLAKAWTGQPVDKSAKSVDNLPEPVDNSTKTVDETVEKPVDEIATYPHIHRRDGLSIDFSTGGYLSTGYPHDLSTGFTQSYTQFLVVFLRE